MIRRLLFKGTLLSKGLGLIERASEDIDVKILWGDIGEPAAVEELVALSNNMRRARLGAKSALGPNSEVPIKPDADDDLPMLNLTVKAVRTVDPEQTFWDTLLRSGA
jgi:hypothetical protein